VSGAGLSARVPGTTGRWPAAARIQAASASGRWASASARWRDILYDIQRHVSRHAYYLFGPTGVSVAAWEPHVRNFAPNIGHDYGGRLMAVWLDR